MAAENIDKSRKEKAEPVIVVWTPEKVQSNEVKIKDKKQARVLDLDMSTLGFVSDIAIMGNSADYIDSIPEGSLAKFAAPFFVSRGEMLGIAPYHGNLGMIKGHGDEFEYVLVHYGLLPDDEPWAELLGHDEAAFLIGKMNLELFLDPRFKKLKKWW